MKSNSIHKYKIVIIALFGATTLMTGCGNIEEIVSDKVKEEIRDEVIEVIADKSSEILEDAYAKKGTETDKTGTELDSFADMKIDELINSEEYISASIEGRKTMAEEVITSLRLMSAIKNVEYSEEDKMYTFEYFSGGLGGLKLEDFEPMMN